MAQPIWVTPAGTLGSYPAGIPISIALLAVVNPPAFRVDTYTLLNGSLPPGLSLSTVLTVGQITGTPLLVPEATTFNFGIRATDELGNIRDRSFSMIVSGSQIPIFTTLSGSILNTNDSIWIEQQINYSNPDPSKPVTITLSSGNLPPGLEITSSGVLHGYPLPPMSTIAVPEVTTNLTITTAGTNILTCLSTDNFIITRPIVFTGTVFGGLVSGTTYYITSVINNTTFTISSTENGPNFILGNASGFATITLPAVSIGTPTITTSSFVLEINNENGGSIESYSITVINQNAPINQGGPGKQTNTRVPAILNTRPASPLPTNDDPYYGYYVLPEDRPYYSYPTSIDAEIGIIRSDNYFAFKIIGYDFDGTSLTYVYANLPIGLTGDPITGWITGTPILSSIGLSKYLFSVAVYKTVNPTIQSAFFTFSYKLSNQIDGIITWVSPSNLGSIYNGAISTKSVIAESDVLLEYRIIDGELPPNLTLLPTGEITGYVANQPTSEILTQGDETNFTFTVKAFSPEYPASHSTKTFTLTITQLNVPVDTLYIKATPSIQDRQILETLLTNTTLIPDEALYRAADPNFGKAIDIIYEHAFGIEASNIDQYLAAIQLKNHYWRNITLGELATAVAKDDNGEIIYEVVYSKIIDNLQNPQGESISKEIYWPRLIDLYEGPWYTSVTDIYTSYVDVLGQLYYTSLTPGYARVLYPNSLANMRTQVSDELGQEQSSKILPLWMTSQQANGNTLGYTQAWVICYTNPGQAETIKNNINTNWKQPDGILWKLNMIDFKIDRFFVDKRLTYNYNNITVPASWTGLPSATPVPDPKNSKDFYVVFPRTTILPSQTQY